MDFVCPVSCPTLFSLSAVDFALSSVQRYLPYQLWTLFALSAVQRYVPYQLWALFALSALERYVPYQL